jgi:hypothetical protein
MIAGAARAYRRSVGPARALDIEHHADVCSHVSREMQDEIADTMDDLINRKRTSDGRPN